MEDILAK